MRRLVKFTLVGVIIVVVFAAGTFLAGNVVRPPPHEVVYSDGGLTCALSPSSPAYVNSLVPEVVRTSQFQTRIGGMPFAFASYDNISNRVLSNGTTTQYLPPIVELVFYSSGSGTSCTNVGPMTATRTLVVQVPIENGGLNVAGATYHVSP